MDLSKIPITDVMTRNVVSVSPSQKLIEVKHIFEKKDFHHHIPVTEKGELKGMISLVDFLFAIKNASLDDNENIYHNLLVKDIMREHVITVSKNSSLKQAAEILAEGNIHAVIVSDENLLNGIVTTADLIRYFLKTNQ